VTLGDEQAKKRGVQKSVRERAGPPTFECCIEMEDREHWHVYDDVASATDDLLSGTTTGTLQQNLQSQLSVCALSSQGLSICFVSTRVNQIFQVLLCTDRQLTKACFC